MAETTAGIKVGERGSAGQSGLFSPDVNMLLLTWITFFLLLIVLYKFAWKPILSALDEREKTIRKSIDDAEKIRRELQTITQTRQQMFTEVEEKSKAILALSRQGALEQAKLIHEKAKEDAKILLENTRREIKDEVEKAQIELRSESARIAVSLAGKIIERNLDDEKNRKLVDELIKDI